MYKNVDENCQIDCVKGTTDKSRLMEGGLFGS